MLPKLLLPLCLFAAAQPALAQTITWSEHIAPILYANCTTCHRPGQVAPFSLLTYGDALLHGRTIAVDTQSRYMPPWKPERGWTAMRDERGLTANQISLIQQWVAGGMQQGDPAKAPPTPTYTDGWQLGTPDLVVTMPAGFDVPADGPDIYRNFVLKTGLTTDKWVSAIELRPSARTVVHHALIYTDTSGGGRKLDGQQDGQPGFPGFGAIINLQANDPLNAVSGGLGGWVPGETPAFLPSGIAMYLQANADILLQTHFHPNGTAATEQTTLALYFAKTPPDRQISQIQAPAFFGYLANISIPAGQSDYTVRGSFTVPVDVDAVSVSSHAHYLGKGSKLSATLPSGEVKVLLWIPQWDFNWQDTYIFKDLVALPAGTRIDGELIYDNSANNYRNPNSPPKLVSWGENSTDEMGSLILNVVPHQTGATPLNTLRTSILLYSSVSAPQVGSKPLFISAGVVDGASAQSGAVTPGKIVVLYGQRMGPAALTTGQPSNGILSSTVGNAQVLFDGIPAPLLYTSTGQVSAIVPYALDGKAGTQIQVKNGSLLSDKVAVPVTSASPSIFSMDYSGTGPGAILNFDNLLGLTLNSAQNPAPQQSIVVIYATGEGQTSPPGVDGKYALATYPKPVQNVQVTIGGLPADVLYAGAAPTLVAGVLQINARIPPGVPSGNAQVQVTVGTAQSQPGITLAVK